MFCDRCGTNLQGSPNYCPTCGKAFRAVPLMPVRSRIGGHVRLLGILWLAISAFRLLPGLFLFTFFHHEFRWWASGLPFFVPGLLRVIGGVFIAGGILGLLAGWGLLDRQPWARMLALVLGCFNLIDMPFGTALGIYTLWVLLPAESEQEYREISRPA
jgi:hypothetical protein